MDSIALRIASSSLAATSEAIADRLGRLGRSWGCPAVRPEVARTMIDTPVIDELLFYCLKEELTISLND